MSPNNDSALIKRCKATLTNLFASMTTLDGVVTLIGLAYLFYCSSEVLH